MKQTFYAIDTNKDGLVSPNEVIDGSLDEYKQLLLDLSYTDEQEVDEEEYEDEENERIAEKDYDDFDDKHDSFETEIKHDDL